MVTELLTSYVVTYFLVTVVCMLGSLMIYRQMTFDIGSEQEIITFRRFLAGYIVFVASNAVWVWINFDFLDIPGLPFSMVNLFAICAASYFWFMYVETKLKPGQVSKSSFRIVSAIPLFVALALILFTPFTGWVFYYTESNEYIHGPLYVTMLLLAILYVMIASVHLIVSATGTTSRTKRAEARTLAAFMLFPVAGGVIDVFIHNLPVMELSLMLGIIIIYTRMQQSKINSDALTGMNNRRRVDDYLQDRLGSVSEEKPLYFFIADADGFKQINDNYGHVEGDRALRVIAQTLKEFASGKQCLVGRWGGDEFAVIIAAHHVSTPEETMEIIRGDLEMNRLAHELPYPLGLSIGYVK
ncbi:MAG: diguanylate cyclase, partial [Lachnospiraceae bacterium]|nr:diguanylate cyclase [Lachnospiraceae bacterium]